MKTTEKHREVVLVSLMLTFNRFHRLFYFYCSTWTRMSVGDWTRKWFLMLKNSSYLVNFIPEISPFSNVIRQKMINNDQLKFLIKIYMIIVGLSVWQAVSNPWYSRIISWLWRIVEYLTIIHLIHTKYTGLREWDLGGYYNCIFCGGVGICSKSL